MSSTIRNILLLVALLAIVGIGYFTFFANGEDPLLSSGISGSDQVRLETQGLLNQLQELQQIKLDQGIFSDARFTSLRDFRQQLIDEPNGRPNPFAPAR